MVFVTLAQDGEIVILDTEDEDIDESDWSIRNRSELQCDKELYESNGKLVKQKTKLPNLLILKAVQVKENIIYFLQNIATFPFTIYHLYRQEIIGQYIDIHE